MHPVLRWMGTVAALLQVSWLAVAGGQSSDSSSHSSAASLAYATFASMLYPAVTPSDFFLSVWEQHPLLVPHIDTPDLYARGSSGDDSLDLHLDLHQMGLLIDSGSSVFAGVGGARGMTSGSDFRLVQRTLAADGEWWTAMVPVSALPAGRPASASFAMQGLQHGFTLVMNRVNFVYEPVARLCSLLEQEVFGFRVQANLYVTPSNASGFEAHFDWQESFVLQLAGQKRWTMMTPPLVRLPRADLKFKPTQAQMQPLSREHMRLTQGNALYFPSGYIHEATTEAATHSNDDEATDAESTNDAELTRDTRESASPLSDDDAAPLPLSMHLTLGVEIDPLFTRQGLLHIFIEQLVQGEEGGAIRSLLSAHIPPCTCCAAAREQRQRDALSSDSSSEPPLRFIDLLHLAVLELSSRADEGSSVRGSPPHHFRKSLWGLHRWGGQHAAATEKSAGTAQVLPSRVGPLELILAPSAQHDSTRAARQSVAFQTHVAERVPLLLRELTSQLLGEGGAAGSSKSTEGARRLCEFVAEIQQRRRSGERRGDAGGSADRPSQTPYKFESFFSDAVLNPLLDSALRSTHLSVLVQVGTPSSCASSYWSTLRAHLSAVLKVVSSHVQLDAWAGWADERQAARANVIQGDSTHDAEAAAESAPSHLQRSLALLLDSLRTMRAHLAAMHEAHASAQSTHLRASQQRTTEYRQQWAERQPRRQEGSAAQQQERSETDDAASERQADRDL